MIRIYGVGYHRKQYQMLERVFEEALDALSETVCEHIDCRSCEYRCVCTDLRQSINYLAEKSANW